MKKIFTILALAMMCCVGANAVSFTSPASNIDFGSQSIKGKSSVQGETTMQVAWTNDMPLYAQVTIEILNQPEENCSFTLNGNNVAYVWTGSGESSDPIIYSYDCALAYYADHAGSYTCQVHMYAEDMDYAQVAEKTINVTLVVTGDADVPQTIPFERIESTSGLSVGDTILFVNEDAGAVNGALSSTYLEAITEGVTINNGHADVPAETVEMFRVGKTDGYWTFTSANGLLGGDGTSLKIGSGTTLWSVSISNGVAEIIPKQSSYPLQYNTQAPRFKLYNADTQADIALYKKAGAAQDLQSSLDIEDIAFGDVENDELKAVTVNYTAANLTDDIFWAIEGTDAALFEVADQGTRDAGTVTITYLGTSDKTGALDAHLSYLTQDIKLDPMEGSKAISINLIPATVKLTNLAFENAPTTIDQGQTIDLSQYVVYTPNNAVDKSLTWSVDHSYQGEIDQDGKLTAYHVSGTVKVTATSVRVPSVSASITLTITTPTITDFTLSKTETTLNIGGQETLTITAFVPDYASASATWASSAPTIAKVNKNGVITAQALGDAVITATIGEVEKSCTVHVVAVTVNSIELPAEANLTIGSSLQLNPVVDPAQAASEYTISYVSGNPEIATVSETGLVHGEAAGDAVITATISDKSTQITIHVVAAQMFSKVTDASTLAEKDTIILARQSVPVIAGPRGTDSNGKKKLTVLLEDVTVTETEAYADNACRMVLGTEKNKEGFTLTIVGGKTIAVTSSGNDIVDANTQNCKFWEFVADGNNGYFVRNLGNTDAMFKYHSNNAAIKPYKNATTGAVYVYAYVRKYVEPSPTGIENAKAEVKTEKVLRNGQVLIIRNGETYTVTGAKVE